MATILVDEKEIQESFAHFGRRMAEIIEAKNKEIDSLTTKLKDAEAGVGPLSIKEIKIIQNPDGVKNEIWINGVKL